MTQRKKNLLLRLASLAVVVLVLLFSKNGFLKELSGLLFGIETETETETEAESTAAQTRAPETAESTVPDTTAAETKDSAAAQTTPAETTASIREDGSYDSKEQVAAYIHQFGRLPSNYISKTKARNLGWEGGSLEPYAPGKCIGGSSFANAEGLLPEKKGRTYTECDIDTLGASSRGAKRIVFSNDGLIYYTDDHYESFELLYGEP